MSRFAPSVLGAVALVLLPAGLRTTFAWEERGTQTAMATVMQPERGLLEWRFNGRKIATYSFASNQFKPYVRELRSLRGDDVLRDAPADHLHHHGLMYAVRVTGVNFWEETNQPGHERHVELLAHGTGRNARGLPQASCTELIHWVPHVDHTRADTAPVALLVERRTLTLTVDENAEEVALAWHADFEIGGGTNRVTLHGSDYNGLGLRLPAAWDHAALHVNSGDTPYPSGGKPGAVPARWGAVSHTVDGRGVQVALFARPRGQAGTNSFFAMTEPFTYLSATQGLDQSPLEYRAGDRFSLDYLVLVCPVTRNPAQLEERYQSWARELQSNER